MFANISPVASFLGTATQLRIGGAELTGFGQMGSMSILWTLADAQGKPLVTDSLRMWSTEYVGWSGQDSDLFAWVASKIGVTLTGIVDDPPPPAGQTVEP